MGYRRQGGFNRRSFSGSGSGAKPVEVGKEYEADITEVSRRGDGVARIEGFVIFVSNAKKGDHVKFKVTSIGNRFATAEKV